MITALRAEYRKTISTRMWWILLGSMAGYMVFLGATMAFVLTTGASSGTGSGAPPIGPEEATRTAYTLAPSLGYVFPAVMGALMVTVEFRHRTITASLLAEPRRGIVLAAKLGVGLAIGALYGVVGTAATVLGSAPVLAWQKYPTMLGDSATWRVLALSALALSIWCLVGVGFGAALSNQVAAIVVLLAFTQLVEPIARFALGAFETTSQIAKWLPGAAGEAITGESFYTATGLGSLLPWWGGALVLLAYGLGMAVLGRLTTLRRDVG